MASLATYEVANEWERARSQKLQGARRREFLNRPEVEEICLYSSEEVYEAFAHANLLTDALDWLRSNVGSRSKAKIDQLRRAAPPRVPRPFWELLNRAAEMREHPTPAEAALAARLSAGVAGASVEPQYVLPQKWIADFFVPAADLVIEVDGDSHDDRRIVDRRRDDQLRADHLEVLRFSNDDVLRDLDAVVASIESVVERRQPLTALRRSMEREADEAEWWLQESRIRDAEEYRRSLPDELALLLDSSNPKCWFRCQECEDRRFFEHVDPGPVCWSGWDHEVVRECAGASCEAPTPSFSHRLCESCQGAKDVAHEAAGRGAKSPTNNLKQASKGRKRVR